MAIEKKPLREILNKNVVTKEGRRLGVVKDITFETKTGELIHLILTTPTAYANSLGLEKTKEGDILVPYNSIIAIGDFVVVSEEDLA
jgi:sporulation protein YlmC with PRC-barrel domain